MYVLINSFTQSRLNLTPYVDNYLNENVLYRLTVLTAVNVGDRTLACINYVLNQAQGVVRVGQPVYQFIW